MLAGYEQIGPLASAYVLLRAISGPVLARVADTMPLARSRDG